MEYDLLRKVAKERSLTLTQLLMALVAEEIQKFLEWWSERGDSPELRMSIKDYVAQNPIKLN
jgi:predicted DNA-binding ribbon-helix-helix protein